eukprot:scaffold6834_cov113-Skeletonema_dohrnii-CCMP3373.AAC.2
MMKRTKKKESAIQALVVVDNAVTKKLTGRPSRSGRHTVRKKSTSHSHLCATLSSDGTSANARRLPLLIFVVIITHLGSQALCYLLPTLQMWHCQARTKSGQL